MPEFGHLTPENRRLSTDLYELTMLQGYYRNDHNPQAVFDLFVRDLPENRGYLVAAGLEQAVAFIDDLSFREQEIQHLQEQGFDDDFLAHLADMTFTGDVRAMPEGTVVFPDEPLIEVEAPLMQAQLLETVLINQIAFQTLIATKAARMNEMVDRHGDGQSLVDFGTRRAHGTDAGIKAARASYIGGFAGTSNVAAGELFDIPLFGTMAHAWIQSFATEQEAFEAYMDVYGEESILLIDTYGTLDGARAVADLVTTSEAAPADDDRRPPIKGVRIDSGDLAALSQQVQEIVGDLGVFVSSGIDEYAIRDFFTDGGTAAGFGVGTNLVTSADAPKLEAVYKLVAVEQDGELQPSVKLSTGKMTYPGRKQVYRQERNGMYEEDMLAVQGEEQAGEPLLVDVITDGEIVYDMPSLDVVQERAQDERRSLPRAVRNITDPASYPVRISERLQTTTERVQDELRRERT